MNCANCGREIFRHSNFCNYCGDRVAVVCSSCNTLNPQNSLFCNACGRSLAENLAESQDPYPGGGEPAYPGVIGIGCPRCRAANEPVSAYCYQCGLPLEGESRSAIGATEVSIPYRSPQTRAIWTSILLVLSGITIVIYVTLTVEVFDLRQRYEAGEFLAFSQLAEAEENLNTASIFNVLAAIAVAVAFLIWIYRASRNLQPLGALGQRFSPRWAVGWWFVPIMFFVRPYQVMAEIWKGSAPDGTRLAPFDWQAETVSALLKWWWALWIVSSIAGLVAGLTESPGGTFDLLASVLTLCDAALAVAVVWRITKRQDPKYRRIISDSSWVS
jgi:hypothetical protein